MFQREGQNWNKLRTVLPPYELHNVTFLFDHVTEWWILWTPNSTEGMYKQTAQILSSVFACNRACNYACNRVT